MGIIEHPNADKLMLLAWDQVYGSKINTIFFIFDSWPLVEMFDSASKMAELIKT